MLLFEYGETIWKWAELLGEQIEIYLKKCTYKRMHNYNI